MRQLLALNPIPKVYIACAGAGAGLFPMLFETCGASQYLVGATYPYAREETDRFIGFKPEKYTSEETAIDLAIAAYLRAAPHGDNPVGLGLSATIAGKEVHRGEHVVHACAFGRDSGRVLSRTQQKGVGEGARKNDDVWATSYAEDAILHAAGGCSDWENGGESGGGYCSAITQRVLAHPVFHRDGRRDVDIVPEQTILLPGNFNPLHQGHSEMAARVSRTTGKNVMYEMCLTPSHKDNIPVAEALRRVACVDRSIVLSEARLYIDKARRWPGVGFIIGVDALIRMLDPKWGLGVVEMLEEFIELGTRFHVFGRKVDGKFVMPWDVWRRVAVKYDIIFNGYGGCWDVSSTKLREEPK